MPDTRQLPFDFPHTPHFTEDEFMPAEGNGLARGFLFGAVPWPGGRLALWGKAGTGKTHLLHLWAMQAGATILSGAALQGSLWPGGPVALDAADDIPDEIALLHLLNATAEAGHKLLLTARQPPARLPVRLPDLASRLRAITSVEVGPADDAFLAGLLARLLASRQMVVPAPLRSWLLTRLPRSPGAIREAVSRLDHAALAAGSAVTRPLAAAALADLLADDGQKPRLPPPRSCRVGNAHQPDEP